jgi:hypothetical protein
MGVQGRTLEGGENAVNNKKLKVAEAQRLLTKSLG